MVEGKIPLHRRNCFEVFFNYFTQGVNQIICKFGKTSVGQASNYMNLIIIFISMFIIGIPKTVYGVFTLLISNKIVDFIILGKLYGTYLTFCILLLSCPSLQRG